jgi:hypothetical protein
MDLLCGIQQVSRSIYGASGSLLRPGPPVDRHVAPETPSMRDPGRFEPK